VQFLWYPFGENLLDGLARQLLDAVRSTQAKRVVIDGIGGFVGTPAFAERGGPFVAALMNELRRLGATTLVTVEESEAGNRAVDTPALSAVADNMLQLSVERDGSVRRFLGIRKSRISRCDLGVRELVLTANGLDLTAAEPAGGV
jgi:circadian clock protein KaiC